jgi:hypothetical protein
VRYEKLAQLLALGMDANKAYQQAGFAPDRSNAAKAAKRPDVAARVRELIEAEEQRLAQARGDGVTETGEQLLRLAAQRALATGNLVALVQAGKQIGESDGSLDALAPNGTDDRSPEELCRSLDKHGPVAALAGRMLFVPVDFKPANAGDADIDLAAAGLARWFSAAQLRALGQRLLSTK